MRVKDSLEDERKYFATHPVYSSMDPKYLGTRALTTNLSQVFFNHLRSFLPSILTEIKEKMKECEDRLRDLGPPMPKDN